MQTIVLLHGAWHGAWCWSRLIPLLRSKDLNVIAPEIDWDCLYSDVSIDISDNVCFTALCDLITRQKVPVVLVGHSAGGVLLSELGEAIPDHIRSLVYVSGFMLENGQCINDTENLMAGSLIQPGLKLSTDKKHIIIPGELLQEGLYADCHIDDVKFARARLCPHPVSSFTRPVLTTAENFGRLSRIYIECLRDRAIPVSAQRAMVTAVGCNTVLSLNSSHSPFFSRAAELAGLLAEIGKDYDFPGAMP